MECRDWKERISAYIDGEAPPPEARNVEEHLAACPGCRALEREMRAVGIGLARSEGTVPPDFRERLFARLEAEDLLPRRRSLFAYSLRWAAIPLAAAAALALFLHTPTDKGKDGITSPPSLPRVVQRAPEAPPGQAAGTASRAEELSADEREIVAHLDILEDPAAFDEPGEVDEMEIFVTSGRRRG